MLPRMTVRLTDYNAFKTAITHAVAAGGGTRSALARQMEADGILAAHTVRCLLGTPGTRIGRRKATFESVLKIAHAAGFDVCLSPRKSRP